MRGPRTLILFPKTLPSSTLNLIQPYSLRKSVGEDKLILEMGKRCVTVARELRPRPLMFQR